jgi:HK97 family phage portal protein
VILKTDRGDRQMFSGAFDSSTPIPRPSQWGGAMSYSGKRVSIEAAVGLPAFMRAIRLICETSAALPLMLSRGQGTERRPQPDAEQIGVLRRPNNDMTAFQVWAFVYACMLRGNALLWKVKVNGKVKALYPLMPSLTRVRRKNGEVIYELRQRETGPVTRTVTKAEIIHIPGIVLSDPSIGVSLIEAHRHGIGTSLARQEFEGRFLANDGVPGVVLKHEGPNAPGEPQRKEIRDSFESRHVGADNAGRPALMWGGWSIDRLAVSLEDAQYVETQRFAVQDIGRMTGVPSGMLDEPAGGKQTITTPEQEAMRLLTYGLSSWMVRLGQGLAADRDLFPEPDWNVEQDHSELLKADIKTRYEANRLARQGGWITANEIRATEGLAPIKGGDKLQETPVGGAPNKDAPAPSPEEDDIDPAA